MKCPKIVIDTNILVSALRSRNGASYRLILLLDSGLYIPIVSVPLVLEYESAAKKLLGRIRLSKKDVEAVIDYFCAQALTVEIFYQWRPFLKDPKDDMVLEAAVASGCSHIVTFNIKDFSGSEQFGIRIVSPQTFLSEIGVKP